MGAGYHGGFGATKGYFEEKPAAGEIIFASDEKWNKIVVLQYGFCVSWFCSAFDQ